MSIELINMAVSKGAKIYASISGGKDGQAMVKTLAKRGFSIAGLVHADLGRTEWPQSMEMCKRLSVEFSVPLHIVRRSDGLDMLAYWQRRAKRLKGTDKPFWSSANNRYCTSDLKRGPINNFFTNCGDFIISAEGIRAGESTHRANKQPLSVRWGKTSKYYTGMSVEEAIKAFKPGKKLALTWYPIFNFSTEEVWNSYGMTTEDLTVAKTIYKTTGIVVGWWPFHAAYLFGNKRVSCIFCIMGCLSDLQNGAVHAPLLLKEMISMEEEGEATFKHNWSLKQLLA